MKKLSLLIALVFSFVSAEAQLLRRSTVDQIKGSKIVVALTADEALNKIWKTAIEERWDFTGITGFTTEEAAFDQLKSNEVDYVLFLNTQVSSRSRGHDRGDFTYIYTSEGMAIELRNGKRSNAAIQYIPPFGDDNEYAAAFVHFGIDAFQVQFETIIEKELKSNVKLYSAFNDKGAQLKDNTLLVLAGWLHKKITIEEAKKLYQGNIEVVAFADWKDAIIEKQAGKAYVVVVPVPVNGKYIYLHYLVAAASGDIIGMGQPKVSFGAFGYSTGNSGFINEKNIEIYNDVITGK